MNFPTVMNPEPEDIKMMLACKSHLGDQNCNPKMERYVYKKRNADGVNVINLAKTYEKLIMAARIIVAIENPGDVCVISGPQIGQRAVLKFARFTGSQAISGRYTPGTFTNQIQKNFLEPRLLVVTDPREDSQAVIEASYVNIPTIAFCNTNCPVKFVDVVIPCNTNTTESVGLMYWLLAREVLRLKNQLARAQPWDIMVDLFFWRSPDERVADEKKADEAAALASSSLAPSGGFSEAPQFQAPEDGSWTASGSAAPSWEAPIEWADAPTYAPNTTAAAAAPPSANVASNWGNPMLNGQ